MKQNNLFETVVFFVFCFCILFISFFHEPWFDEFQAWGIAQDSLYNILFVIPHFEGHPPFWHLILKVFSFLEPQDCIKIPNLIFVVLSSWFIIFKSPFLKIIRCTIPFTYFIFYQYAVISRPYSILLFSFVLCAYFYKTKDEKPFRFVFSLFLMSLSSAYGILFAFGICLSRVIELLIKYKKSFLKTKQFKALCVLFILCLILGVMISPAPNNGAKSFLSAIPLWVRSLYGFFGVISDCSVFDIVNYSKGLDFSKYEIFDFCNFSFGVVFGFCLVLFLAKIFKKINMLNYFLIPYIVFCSFCSFIYIWPHHEGILFLFLIFVFWIGYDKLKEKLSKKENIILCAIISLTILIQIFWSIRAYSNEYRLGYSSSKEISNYIKENNLENLIIFSSWKEIPENQFIPVLVNPYFRKNIFDNFNIDCPEKLYSTHRINSDEEDKIQRQRWRALGLPDIILGEFDYEYIWDKSTKRSYRKATIFHSNTIWKARTYFGIIPLYVRLDKIPSIIK